MARVVSPRPGRAPRASRFERGSTASGPGSATLRARAGAGQDIAGELEVGARLAEESAARASAAHKKKLAARSRRRSVPATSPEPATRSSKRSGHSWSRYSGAAAAASPTYGIWADRVRARFSTWYELFPRSASGVEGRHGSFLDVIDRLDYVRAARRRRSLPAADPSDRRHQPQGPQRRRRGGAGRRRQPVGDRQSPTAATPPSTPSSARSRTSTSWSAPRRDARHRDRPRPRLPVLARPPVGARAPGVVQAPPGRDRSATPRTRPRSTRTSTRSTSTPPTWRDLWHGAARASSSSGSTRASRIFRVDNPHTKPFPFWEWLIPTIHESHPDVLFLAEAFTRPKIMKRLAKLGFTQSYTYFAWRTAKWEIEQYLTELTADGRRRLLPAELLAQHPRHPHRAAAAGRPHVRSRCAPLLAGTLAASYGIYGPVFELAETSPATRRLRGVPRRREVRAPALRPRRSRRSLAPFLTALNTIRHEQLALQHDRTLEFHQTDNDAAHRVLEDGVPTRRRRGPVGRSDPRHRQPRRPATASRRGSTSTSARSASPTAAPYDVHDLLTGARYQWNGSRNFVMLDPDVTPAHIFRIEPAAEVSPRDRQTVAPIIAADSGDRDLVQGRRHLRGARARLRRQRRRRDRRLQRPARQARLPAGARRHRAVAAAVLSVTAARRRLRHLRLPQGARVLRHAARLPCGPARRRTPAASG